MISGVFEEVEAPGYESGNHKEIAQDAVYQLHNGLLFWAIVLALLAIY